MIGVTASSAFFTPSIIALDVMEAPVMVETDEIELDRALKRYKTSSTPAASDTTDTNTMAMP